MYDVCVPPARTSPQSTYSINSKIPTDPEVRQHEQTNDTESRRVARTNPEVRQHEQTNNTESRRAA